MPAVREALRARATTSSTEAPAASMVTTEFCAIGAMTSARPGLNRLFAMTLIVSGCTPVARPMAVAINGERHPRDVGPGALGNGQHGQVRRGRAEPGLPVPLPGLVRGWRDSPNVCAGMCPS